MRINSEACKGQLTTCSFSQLSFSIHSLFNISNPIIS